MASQEIIDLNGMAIKFCLDEQDTNGKLTMFEVTVEPGTRMPAPHYHKDFDETIYGLEGVCSYTIDGKPVEIGPGNFHFIPRGVVHGFENKTNGCIKFLCMINPGIFGPSYFKDIATILGAGGPPDMAKLMAVMTKHGLVPVVSK